MNLIDELTRAAAIRAKAGELGFDRFGIARAEPSEFANYLRNWLDDGQAGEMAYIADRFDERTDPRTYFPQAASVICVAANYFVPLEPIDESDEKRRGRVARYALGDDYHEWMTTRLHALADWLRESFPEARTRCCTDTAPIMEKEMAARAGIGWIGKNTCVINERIGSWLFLGEIVTNLQLPADEPSVDRCGSCRRCIDACPTGAITQPYQLDARKCISYLTIEHRGEIAPDLSQNFGNWIYGCDICQDVCPWNREPPAAKDPQLQPRFATGTLDLDEVAGWSNEDYRKQLRNSAMKRVKLPILKRNAAIAMENLRS